MNWLHSIIRAAPALGLAAVLAVAGPSQARGWHGGFHVGGWHGGGFHYGGFYGQGYGGYHGYGYRGYGYRGYYPHYGWGLGYYPYSYGLGYGSYPSYYYNYNAYPSYYYPTAGYLGTPTNYYQSMYPAATAAVPTPNTVRLNVHLPAANAKVWIDSTLTRQTGTDRVFVSPALTPGSNYSYTVRAQWTRNGQPVEQSRTVRFHAGEQVYVNFDAAS